MIGSGVGNEVVVSDETASELHCELRIEPNRVRIVDLGSHNGTRVDGVRIFDACIGDRSVHGDASDDPTIRGSGHWVTVQHGEVLVLVWRCASGASARWLAEVLRIALSPAVEGSAP